MAGPDIIDENEVDGFIIHSGNKTALANATQGVVEDPAMCYFILGIIGAVKGEGVLLGFLRRPLEGNIG